MENTASNDNLDIGNKQPQIEMIAGHKVAYTLTIEGENGETKSCKLKKLDRTTLEIAMSHAMPGAGQPPKYFSAGEIILKTCWLDGDKELLEDDDWCTGAFISS